MYRIKKQSENCSQKEFCTAFAEATWNDKVYPQRYKKKVKQRKENRQENRISDVTCMMT